MSNVVTCVIIFSQLLGDSCLGFSFGVQLEYVYEVGYTVLERAFWSLLTDNLSVN